RGRERRRGEGRGGGGRGGGVEAARGAARRGSAIRRQQYGRADPGAASWQRRWPARAGLGGGVARARPHERPPARSALEPRRQRHGGAQVAVGGRIPDIPYAHSPSVRKLSKIATLLLAKNYILMQAQALDEMRRLVAYLNQGQGLAAPVAAAPLTPFGQTPVCPFSAGTALGPCPDKCTAFSGTPSSLCKHCGEKP
uniref:BHLH domain-containing protein n=1 Tax=Otolemur garnettii TaxID=30611 RepID=H0XJ44_OTOGA